MEISQDSTGMARGGNHGKQGNEPRLSVEKPSKLVNIFPIESSVSIGAKTLAGVGIGLIAVIAATAAVTVATEVVLIPSLLLKLAGGITGAGLGMAKGLNDERKKRVTN
jgi:hypothetical protein